MAFVTYTNLEGPREGSYAPTIDVGQVSPSPNNDKTYLRIVPPESKIASGAADTEGAIQILESDGVNKTAVKLQPFLQAAYELEADYDNTVTLQIDGGTFVDQNVHLDNTGYIYAHVETSISGTIHHYMMTSKDGGITWSAYRFPQNADMAMAFNGRPIR